MGAPGGPSIQARVSAFRRSSPYAACSGSTPPCTNTVLPTCAAAPGERGSEASPRAQAARVRGSAGARSAALDAELLARAASARLGVGQGRAAQLHSRWACQAGGQQGAVAGLDVPWWGVARLQHDRVRRQEAPRHGTCAPGAALGGGPATRRMPRSKAATGRAPRSAARARQPRHQPHPPSNSTLHAMYALATSTGRLPIS